MASPVQAEPQQQESYDRKEEYLQAQRAAIEAVYVGRETLQQSVQQGEQLNRAEMMAEETEYKLDKAGRILRGMTWSGWVANMFTKSVGPPPEVKDSTNSDDVPTVYEGVSPECQETAQAVQNYHANVKVLESCETDEQKETLKVICDTMYDSSTKSLDALKLNYPDLEAYTLQFDRDLAVLRNRQKQSQEMTRELGSPASGAAANTTTPEDQNRAELFSSASTKSPPAATQEKISHPHIQEQDQHLAVMAQSLGELGTIAQNLHQSIAQQHQTINSLDERTENITEKSKMVTRRADRLVQKRSWKPTKPTFHSHVSIRHIASGRYLAALDDKDLFLVPRYHPETCVFGLWHRQGEIFGLQNRFSGRWAGQSMLGSVACSARTFGRREEWEASGVNGVEDWSNTRLLCASAGWGAGGYLIVRPKDFAVLIGGCTVEERNKADAWAIMEQQNIPTVEE